LGDDTGFRLPDWPRANGEPPGSARLRQYAADFQVTELLGFDPSGDGEHDLLYVEKTGLNTSDVARDLARHADSAPGSIGYAGLKDRQAVTRQWFSVQRPPRRTVDWGAYARDGVHILDIARHRRKLKRGAHRGNHFRLVLRDVLADPACLERQLTSVRNQGVPNYFGEQRFGRGAGNLELARQLFAGRRLPRERRSLALSAARSLIFNEVLAARVVDGSWNRLRPGDIANLDGSESIFAVDDVDAALNGRVNSFDVHPTGPMWGRPRPMPGPEFEASIAARHEDLATGLEQWVDASRRSLRLPVRDLAWQPAEGNLVLTFTLPRGAFATAVVREVVRYDE